MNFVGKLVAQLSLDITPFMRQLAAAKKAASEFAAGGRRTRAEAFPNYERKTAKIADHLEDIFLGWFRSFKRKLDSKLHRVVTSAASTNLGWRDITGMGPITLQARQLIKQQHPGVRFRPVAGNSYMHPSNGGTYMHTNTNVPLGGIFRGRTGTAQYQASRLVYNPASQLRWQAQGLGPVSTNLMQAKHLTTFGKAVSALKIGLGTMGSAFIGVVSPIAAVTAIFIKLATVTAVAQAAIIPLVAGLVAMGLQFERLKTSLLAIEGKNAPNMVRTLTAMARMPGVNFQEAAIGYTRMRATMNQQDSLRVIREFGNVNAIYGGNRETLERIYRAISQTSTKEFMQAEELVQLAEANIPGRALLKRKFGTSDTEELKKRGITSQQAIMGIVEELEKMPRAANSMVNVVDNMWDSIIRATQEAGLTMAEQWRGFFSGIDTSFRFGNQGGVWNRLGTMIAGSYSGLGAAFGLDTTGQDLATLEGAIDRIVRGAATSGNYKTIRSSYTDPVTGEVREAVNYRLGKGDSASIRDLALTAEEKLLARIAAGIEIAVRILNDLTQIAFDGLTRLLKFFNALVPWWAKQVVNLAMPANYTEQFNKAVGEYEGLFRRGRVVDANGRLTAMMAAQEEANRRQNGEEPLANSIKQTGFLATIAENTTRMVEITRATFGGGDLAAQGVTPFELGSVGREAYSERVYQRLLSDIMQHMSGQGTPALRI